MENKTYTYYEIYRETLESFFHRHEREKQLKDPKNLNTISLSRLGEFLFATENEDLAKAVCNKDEKFYYIKVETSL